MAPRKKPQHLRDLDELMSLPAGARFIWRLLERAGVYRSSFSTDALIMAAQEGRRDIGLKLLAEILEACPEKYINLLKSSKERREKANEEANHVVEVPDDDAFAADHAGDGTAG